MQPIFLASYPRSGNTLLRTILFQCFDLKSGSIYRNDLGGNIELEKYVGHIEMDDDGSISYPEGGLPILKTHSYHKGNNLTIYVVRDGRAATASLWNFTYPKVPMIDIIEGNNRFGKWCEHLNFWKPQLRPNTLFLRYEDILNDLDSSLTKISDFLGREIISNDLPSREKISDDDGKWVRKKTDWREVLTEKDLERFNELNIHHLNQFDYK
tara:strand:+ start:77 stop:709 length:633 start_codon:yes stop_codon:yes gene_type:complete